MKTIYTSECVGLEVEAYRRCSHCGKPMKSGFYLDGEYACSEDCVKALYGGGDDAWDKYLADYDDGNGECYYTEWESYAF